MKPVTLKQPAVGHAKSYEACSPRSGNLTGGDVYDSKAASNQSRLRLVGLDDKLGVVHLEYRATGYRDFETSVVGEVFVQWNPLISSGDRTISPRTDNGGAIRDEPKLSIFSLNAFAETGELAPTLTFTTLSKGHC